MDVQELNRDQLSELKQNYFEEKYDYCLSYGEMLEINDLVSDEEIMKAYKNYVFFEDDFACSANM